VLVPGAGVRTVGAAGAAAIAEASGTSSRAANRFKK